LEDPDTVDARRAGVGLEPLELYIRRATERYGARVIRVAQVSRLRRGRRDLAARAGGDNAGGTSFVWSPRHGAMSSAG
jgi:hypothetical protein